MEASTQRFGAYAQVARLTEDIAAAERMRERILANIVRVRAEPDNDMTKRLRAYRTRQGFREARYRLTDGRAKQSEPTKTSLRLLLFINNKWKRSRTGFKGVELRIEDMAAALKVSERAVYRALARLDEEQLVIRLKHSGDKSRYAVTMPESAAYQDALRLVFDVRAERIREQLAEERICIDAAA